MVVRAILMLCLLIPAAEAAEIYKYTDENGVVMLTDIPRGEDVIKARDKRRPTKVVDYQQLIVKKADKYRLDPTLISAVISTESAFDSGAISQKGAMGLMQLMPTTAREMGVRNPFNPEENIEGGTRYLQYLLKKYNGDLTRALAAYNAGPTRVESGRRLPLETRNYIKRVYSIYRGEKRVHVSQNEEKAKVEKTVIYRVVLDDGHVLFTNYPPFTPSKEELQRL